MNKDELERQLLAAHGREDLAQLSDLYGKAADWALGQGDTEGASFYLTHAYVFALQKGLPTAKVFHQRLKEMGREE